jgi:hypothetical protein
VEDVKLLNKGSKRTAHFKWWQKKVYQGVCV